MDIKRAIEIIEAELENPTRGLPDDVFYFLSRITPLVNVDLLIKDDQHRTLLAWRQDEFAGSGWHIPGGILRYKETLETRVNEVALSEIGRELNIQPVPIVINQLWKKQQTRGHFISILYGCTTDAFEPENKGLTEGDKGYLKWHESCPDNLIVVHDRIYRKYIATDCSDDTGGEIPFEYFPNL